MASIKGVFYCRADCNYNADPDGCVAPEFDVYMDNEWINDFEEDKTLPVCPLYVSRS